MPRWFLSSLTTFSVTYSNSSGAARRDTFCIQRWNRIGWSPAALDSPILWIGHATSAICLRGINNKSLTWKAFFVNEQESSAFFNVILLFSAIFCDSTKDCENLETYFFDPLIFQTKCVISKGLVDQLLIK